MSEPHTLDERIAALVPEMDATLRTALRQALATLRGAGNIPGAIVSASRLIEGERGLLGRIASARGHKLKGFNLEVQVEELAQKGIVPAEIASDFHWVRVRGTRARHNIEKATLTLDDAETALSRALRTIEWFHCEYEQGPRLPTIYSAEPAPPITHIHMLETFVRSQQATEAEKKQLAEELERLRAQQAAADQRRRELVRERVVGPVPSAVIQHFKDRVPERRSLREQLANEHVRLVLVCGRGGMGKTALITKLLQDLQVDWTLTAEEPTASVDSIVYIALRQPEFRSPDKIIELVYRILPPEAAAELRAKWQEKTSLSDKLEFFFRHTLSAQRCLIVLDNLEDVLDDENRIRDEFGDLRQFVETCLEWDHGARVVATSRRTLVLSPEVEGRSGERRAELRLDNGLPETEAAALLRELDTDGRLGIKDAPTETVCDIARRCYGIPRTIETLVGTLRQRRTLTVARLLDDAAAFARLTDNPARELYESLLPPERLVMQALAVYDRPMPAAAVRYLLPALPVDDLLDTFVRNYVATYDREHFSLHPLDQQYAYRQIPDADGDYARPALHARAAEYFRRLRKPREAWKTIDDLEPQLQEFPHLVRAGLFDSACSVLNEIDYEYLYRWGHWTLLAELHSQLMNRLADPKLQEDNWGSLGSAYYTLGEVRKGIAYYEQSLAIARETGNRQKEGQWLGNLGNAYHDLGEVRKALEYHEQALAIAREIGDRQGEGLWLGNLGNAYHVLGEVQKGVEYFEQALAIAHEIGDRQKEGLWLGNLGVAYSALEEVRKALKYFEQALAIAHEIGDRQKEGLWLGNLGIVYYDLGKVRKGVEYFEQALAIAREIGDRQSEGYLFGCLGSAYYTLGEVRKGVEYYEQALAIAREIGDRQSEGLWLGNLEGTYHDLEEVRKALEYHKQALAIAREIGAKENQSEALLGLGTAHHVLGNLADARCCYEEALTLGISSTNYRCTIKLGILCLQEGKGEEARDSFARGIVLSRALVEKTPHHYSALYCLALAYLSSEQHDEARATYRQALAVCSAKGVVQNALRDLHLLQQAVPVTPGLQDVADLLHAALQAEETR